MDPEPNPDEPPREAWGGYAGLCRFNERLERVLALAAGAFLALFTIVVATDVFYRQILSQPLMWPSEWSVMAFVWSVMLGAAVSAGRQSHFVVVLLPDLTGVWERALRIVIAVLSVVFSLVLVYFGWRMAMTGLRRATPMMGYPMVYVFAAFPAAGVAFLLFTAEQLIAAILGYRPRHEQHLQTGAM